MARLYLFVINATTRGDGGVQHETLKLNRVVSNIITETSVTRRRSILYNIYCKQNEKNQMEIKRDETNGYYLG